MQHFLAYLVRHNIDFVVISDFDDEEAEKLPKALEDMMNRENDFPARAHCLVRWYGLREFVTICPSNPNHPIMSLSKAKLLLSSATIAANNTSW